MSRLPSIFFTFLGLCLILVLAACSGAAGPIGPAGAVGPVGAQGPVGAPGKDGLAGKSMTLPPGPGLIVKITKVELPATGNPKVTVTLTDAAGNLVPSRLLEGAGFTVAQLVEDSPGGDTTYTHYSSLLVHSVDGKPYQLNGETKQPALAKTTQAYADSGGTWTDQSDGSLVYTFKDALSSPVAPQLTTLVGVYVYKDKRASVGNDVYTFVPAGGEPKLKREVVTTAACQSCHNPLEAHGGLRRQIGLCESCHTGQTLDPETGNILDLKVMVHRVHAGSQLPSVAAKVPYLVVGFNQSANDFSKASWPQDIRNCTTCHSGGGESDFYQSKPNAAACTSCHDNVNVTTGENHPGGVQQDGDCAACHEPSGGEFDASISGAHMLPTASAGVKGLKLEIVSVDGAVPGEAPTVKFKVTNKAGETVDPDTIGYLALTLAGPTTDYTNRWTEIAASTVRKVASKVKAVDGGAYQYQFEAKIPADAKGTFAIGMEGYVVQSVGAKGDTRIAAFNPVTYVSVDKTKAVDRRKIVDQAKCNACHKSLSAHGGVRQNVAYCVLCHNPMASDADNRPADQQPAASISFPVLIHRVHKGGSAAQPLKVFGGGGNAADFSGVVFPGDLSACQTCHLANTYSLPLPASNHPITITQKDKAPMTILLNRAICTSCHDNLEASGHVDLQTTASGIETCLVCHGQDKQFDVAKFHH